jgi:hypothetical protein
MRKKILLSAFVIAACCVALLSCNSKAKGSGEAYPLKIRLEKNDSFKNNSVMNMQLNFTAEGKQINMTMDMDASSNFKVLENDGDKKVLEMVMSKMESSAKMTLPDGSVQQLPQSNQDHMTGKQITLTLDKNNEVVSSTGIEQLQDSDPAMDSALKEEFKKMFSPEQINSMYGMLFQMYPAQPVRVGDEWEKVFKFNMGGIVMRITTIYTLTQIKDSVATLDIKGTIGGKGSMEVQGTGVEMDMKGDQKGTMEIWQATGYIKDSKYELDFGGTMNLTGQKIPVNAKVRCLSSDK